ncbi:unnamed protein product [Amoebophrya sp. A120]|nr:unnamed protein product [Amoebophrya sp. A120]|eukprot:GSA120T00005750001.1
MSGMNEQDMRNVVNACAALYGGDKDANKIKEANTFLTEWQCAESAWATASEILSRANLDDTAPTNVATVSFAAQTLRTKILYDVNDLSTQEQMTYLRTALFQSMARLRDRAPFGSALTQLCLALCGLAIHMDEFWPDLIQSLFRDLGAQTANYVILLDLLRFMPEENKNKRLLTDSEKRKRNRRRLHESMPQVFQFLQTIEMPTTAAKVKVLECFSAWTKFSDDPADLFSGSNSLLVPCFSYLGDPELGSVASDVIVEGLDLFREKDLQQALAQEGSREAACVAPIMSSVLNLRPQFEAALSASDPSIGDQDDVLRRFIRVIATAGEALVQVIARNPAQYNQFLELLVLCLKVPVPHLANIVVDFWLTLTDTFAGATSNSYEMQPPQSASTIEQTEKLYKHLFGVLLEVSIVPHQDIKNPFEDADEDWERFRWEGVRSLGSTITEYELVRRGEVFQLLVQSLKQESARLAPAGVSGGGGSSSSTAPNGASRDQVHLKLEAHFFLLQVVAMCFHIDPEHSAYPAMIELLTFLPNLIQSEPAQTDNRYYLEFCQHSALGLIDTMAGNLGDVSEELMQANLNCVCQVLLADGAKKSKDKQRAAGYAFSRICNRHRSNLVKYLPQLLSVYGNSLELLPLKIHLEVTRGLTEVLMELEDLHTFREALEKMIVPLVNGLRHENVTPPQLGEIVDRLVMLMDHTDMERMHAMPGFAEALGGAFLTTLYPTVNRICHNHPTEEDLIEKITRFQKHALRKMPRVFKQVLPTYIETITVCFEKKLLSSWLYASEYVVSEYGNDPEVLPALAQLFERMGKAALPALMAMRDDDLNAELIEDFYGMYGRYAKCAPAVVYNSETLKPSLDLLPKCLLVTYHNALESQLGFLENMLREKNFQVTTSGPLNPMLMNHPGSPQPPGPAMLPGQFLLQCYGQQVILSMLRCAVINNSERIRDAWPTFLTELRFGAQEYQMDQQYRDWLAHGIDSVLPWRKFASEKEVTNWLHALQWRNIDPNDQYSRHGKDNAEKAWKQIWFRIGQLQARRKK